MALRPDCRRRRQHVDLWYAADDPWGVSLRTTVGVIATAGAPPLEVDRPGMQVFVSFLRIAGAALTAVFTAIVTQYLLRARLGGAFEVRRIPDGGHVVVCGLGNVGFRVVEELLRAEELVVVIESDRNNRFLASARRLGAVIVPGDATVPEVLRQARAVAARAVVAATGNDLANVEVALLCGSCTRPKRGRPAGRRRAGRDAPRSGERAVGSRCPCWRPRRSLRHYSATEFGANSRR